MKIHEYQAKAILARYGVTLPAAKWCSPRKKPHCAHASDAGRRRQIAVHAGGRGKAGGVKFAHPPDEAAEIACHMLGMNLVTTRTGPAAASSSACSSKKASTSSANSTSASLSTAPPAKSFSWPHRRRHGNRGSRQEDS